MTRLAKNSNLFEFFTEYLGVLCAAISIEITPMELTDLAVMLVKDFTRTSPSRTLVQVFELTIETISALTIRRFIAAINTNTFDSAIVACASLNYLIEVQRQLGAG